jgi:predicted nuclease with TOPRIM domain
MVKEDVTTRTKSRRSLREENQDLIEENKVLSREIARLEEKVNSFNNRLMNLKKETTRSRGEGKEDTKS